MSEYGPWMKLTGGFAPEPDTGDWDELTSVPGPSGFLRALFGELSGVDVARVRSETRDPASDEDLTIRHFRCGTADVGILQTEEVVEASSMFPVSVTVETFGLPGIELRWRFALEKAGQMGHCAFRHRRLTVRFIGPGARTQFEETWSSVFQRRPELRELDLC